MPEHHQSEKKIMVLALDLHQSWSVTMQQGRDSLDQGVRQAILGVESRQLERSSAREATKRSRL